MLDNKNKIVKMTDVVSKSALREEAQQLEQQEQSEKKPSKFSFLELFKINKKKADSIDEKHIHVKIKDDFKEARIEEIKVEKSLKANIKIISDFLKPVVGETCLQRSEVVEKIKKEEPFGDFKKIIEAGKKLRKDEEKTEEDFLKEEIGSAGSDLESKSKKIWKYLVVVLILIFAGVGIYAAIFILPKTEIKIVTKKFAWNFNEMIFASINATNINTMGKQIPAMFFSETKNVNLSYSATGKKNVEKKASGEIIVYNSFSSEPQNLVKGTRFETPDGKIFRLENSLIVPGAKVIDAKIVPSNIKAKVVADKAGTDYNIAPVEKFTIPGFKDSAKYGGFYAKSENAMTGGFVGEVLYPTESDMKTAREKTEAALKENLNVLLLSQIPPSFKIIDSGKKFRVTKENISQEVDKDGKFSVFIEGEMTIAAFKESDVLKLMLMLAKQSLGENFEAKNFEADYGVGQIDSGSGKFSFIFNYKGDFWQPINVEKFKNDILGKKELELKTAVFLMPGVEKTTISFWPFWVKTVPKNINRINVIVD